MSREELWKGIMCEMHLKIILMGTKALSTRIKAERFGMHFCAHSMQNYKRHVGEWHTREEIDKIFVRRSKFPYSLEKTTADIWCVFVDGHTVYIDPFQKMQINHQNVHWNKWQQVMRDVRELSDQLACP